MKPELMDTILKKANIGLWTIEMDEGCEPRMYADSSMRELLGIHEELTPEQTYRVWYDGIHQEHRIEVQKAVEEMSKGKHAEVQYPWSHSQYGMIFVRCGGVLDTSYQKGMRFTGVHQNVTELIHLQHRVEEAVENEKREHEVLKGVASIYHTMHMIDLEENREYILQLSQKIREFQIDYLDAEPAERMHATICKVISDKYREKALAFTDLPSLRTRLKDKKTIYEDVVSRLAGWVRLCFIKISENLDGEPTRVVFTTQIINDSKGREERLLQLSMTDELTGLYNRRAYEKDILEMKMDNLHRNLRFVCVDLNRLKYTNDTFGHAAGDELICGVADCMKQSMGMYGKVYRVGGDEFEAILFCNNETLDQIMRNFERRILAWTGNYNQELSVSKGVASAEDYQGATVFDLEKEADRRMYRDKEEFYRKNGIDRRNS